MLAARLHAPGEPLRLEELPLPDPDGTAVRIRVAGCGICRTDLHLADGSMGRVTLPRTLGHEIAGWVDAAGTEAAVALGEAGLLLGDPVVVYGGWGCGRCRDCRAGAEQRCPSSVAPGFQADGGYADAVLVPHPRHLEPLGVLDPIHAAPLADAGVTARRAVTRGARWAEPGRRAVVIGAGGVGSFVVQLLRHAAGPDLVIGVRDPAAGRAEAALSIGANVALPDDAEAADLIAILGGPADLVVDVVGTDGTLALAAEVVAPDGGLVLVGEAGGRLSFGFDAVPPEAWLTTVAWGGRDDLAAVVRLAREGSLRWTTEAVGLRQANAAHDRLRRGAVDGRLVLVPGA